MFELTPSAIAMLRAVFGMGALTMVMAGWQAGTRMPAMRKAGLDLKAATHVVDLNAALPSSVRRVNDNYNHLLEAPTVFYAMTLAIIAADLASPLYAVCAWVYLVARIAHSLVQATINIVALRAMFYGVSWLALVPMIIGPLVSKIAL